MYRPRTVEACVKTVSKRFPVLWLTGARQVGKSTLLRQLVRKKRTVVTLDDPLALSLAREDPALFLQRYPPPLLIDDIQYAPELYPSIAALADRSGEPGLFWLAGSHCGAVGRSVPESLAGRVGALRLLGLSRAELTGSGPRARPFLPAPEELNERAQGLEPLTLKELYRHIWRGGLPEVAANDAPDRDQFFASYVRTLLQRDVRDLTRVEDEMAFLRFLRGAAARSGRMLNLAELARDADIAVNTAKNWLSILQTTGVVYLLEPYRTDFATRLVRTPKLYFLDTGLCAYLTKWSSPKTLEAGAMSAAILETWIVSELLKSYLHNGLDAPFWYYRDKDQKEIDLLIVRDGTIFPLAFKKTSAPTANDVRPFKALEKLKAPIGPGGVICLAEQSSPLAPAAVSIPVSAI